MAVLTREIALAEGKKGFKQIEIDVSELNPDAAEPTVVYVRELSAGEKDEFEASLYKRDKRGGVRLELEDARAKLAVRACCDATGAKIFLPNDVDALSELPASVLSKIYDAAQELNKVDDEELEELVKNSKRIGALDSGSNSL